jgi:hypothetical protein
MVLAGLMDTLVIGLICWNLSYFLSNEKDKFYYFLYSVDFIIIGAFYVINISDLLIGLLLFWFPCIYNDFCEEVIPKIYFPNPPKTGILWYWTGVLLTFFNNLSEFELNKLEYDVLLIIFIFWP